MFEQYFLDNDPKGPWCYISQRKRGKKARFQYCTDIKYCEDLQKTIISQKSPTTATTTFEVTSTNPTTMQTTGHHDVEIMTVHHEEVCYFY